MRKKHENYGICDLNVKASPPQDGRNLHTVTKTPANRLKEQWNPPNENCFPISLRGTASTPGENSSKKTRKQTSSRRKRTSSHSWSGRWVESGRVGWDGFLFM
jgi:hypothetical protein